MVVGTYRDADMNVSRGLAKTLEDSVRGRLATRVKLKGLPRDEVAAMLEGLSGKSPPATMVSEIHAETDGNPFFVEELFRHLEEENRLYDSSGQFRSELKIGELEAPPSVRLVVARRLARLSDLTQKMLATAAVIGRFFSLDILQASSEGDADSTLERVEEAEKAGLVFSVAESPKVRFAFSHELIRQAVIAGLSAARRQRLHLAVGDAIERTYLMHWRTTGASWRFITIAAAMLAKRRSTWDRPRRRQRSALPTLKQLPSSRALSRGYRTGLPALSASSRKSRCNLPWGLRCRRRLAKGLQRRKKHMSARTTYAERLRTGLNAFA